jgi:glycosyltransferase involved in cell wall biosynthesis
MRIVEIDAADAAPHDQDAAVWLVWRGDVPLGALVRSAEIRPALPLNPPPARRAPPTMSVVVCSRDRPESLRGCLAELGRQRQPADEVLVVDNASRDGRTRRVAERAGVRWVAEPRPGVCFARNRGLAEARCEAVAFLDDDCRPVSGWLSALRHAFACEPQAACCTGPVVPAEIVTEAQRLMEQRGGYCKGFERRVFTRDSHTRQWRHYPLQTWMFGTGANMAFVREALLAAGGFAEDLPRGEDLDAFFRILRDGHALVYEPCATLTHDHVRERDALRDRLFGWGYGYSAFLARVSWEEPAYRRLAIAEIGGFLAYQLRKRWWPALRGRGDLPRDLVTAELLGAVAGIPGYWLDRAREQRKASTTEDTEGTEKGLD